MFDVTIVVAGIESDQETPTTLYASTCIYRFDLEGEETDDDFIQYVRAYKGIVHGEMLGSIGPIS